MTADSRLERGLASFFASEAHVRAPADLHEAAMARVGRVRQRPAVLASLRRERLLRGGLSSSLLVVLAAAALVLLALAGAFAAGTFRWATSERITYVYWDAPSDYSIWSVGADGTGDRRIGSGECPSISADGKAMIFVSGRRGNFQGRMIAAKGDGSEQRVLEDVQAWGGALAPDGSRVAWAKDLRPITTLDGLSGLGGEVQLWVSPLSGGPGMRIARIVPRAGEQVELAGLAWSPTGDRIAFVEAHVTVGAGGYATDASIWAVNADGSDLRQVGSALPQAMAAFISTPSAIAWSADGRSLTYGRDAGSGPQRFVLPLDGSPERALPGPDGVASPDGRYLAYGDADGIFTVELSDGIPVGQPRLGSPVTDTGASWSVGAWSPDSRRLLIVEGIHTGDQFHFDNWAGRMFLIDPAGQAPPTLLLDREYSFSDFSGCPPIWTP